MKDGISDGMSEKDKVAYSAVRAHRSPRRKRSAATVIKLFQSDTL